MKAHYLIQKEEEFKKVFNEAIDKQSVLTLQNGVSAPLKILCALKENGELTQTQINLHCPPRGDNKDDEQSTRVYLRYLVPYGYVVKHKHIIGKIKRCDSKKGRGKNPYTYSLHPDYIDKDFPKLESFPDVIIAKPTNIEVKDDSVGYIYLITEDDGYKEGKESAYKIGISKEGLYQRRSGLNGGNHRKLKYVYKILARGYKLLEKILHAHFNYCKVNGEWFRLSPSIVYDFPSIVAEFGNVIEIKQEEEKRLVDAQMQLELS